MISIPKFPNDCGKELDYDLRRATTWRFTGTCCRKRRVFMCRNASPISLRGVLVTMTWLDGEPLLNCAEAPSEVRNAVARQYVPRLVRAAFYYYAVIHGDPHLGNYSVRDDQSDQSNGFRMHPEIRRFLRSRRDRRSTTRFWTMTGTARPTLTRPGAFPRLRTNSWTS